MTRPSPGRILAPQWLGIAIRTVAMVAAAACGSAKDRPAPARPGPTMLPAPYINPVVGTRLVYDGFVNVIVKASDWRIEFRDEHGVMGARVGEFIPDNPRVPLVLDVGLLAQLWPLRTGNAVDVEAQRYPLIWRWHIAVTGTAHIDTKAGPFDCFVVEAIETPVVSTSNQPYTDVTRYWYAPSVGHVVRIEAERVGGPGAGARRTAELVRIDRADSPETPPRSNRR